MLQLTSDRVSIRSFQGRNIFLKTFLSPYFDKKSIVMDAGCGYRNHLINNSDVQELVGIDMNDDAINNNQDISYGIKAKLEELEKFLDFERKFDLVMSYFVIEHIEKPEKFIFSVSKILKQGGHFFFFTPNKLSIWGLTTLLLPTSWLRFLSRTLYGWETKNEVHYYRMNRINTIVQCLEANKFDNIHIVHIDFLYKHGWSKIIKYPDYLIGRSGLIKNYSSQLVCLARLS